MFEEEIIQPHPAYVFTHMSCEPCAMTSTQLEEYLDEHSSTCIMSMLHSLVLWYAFCRHMLRQHSSSRQFQKKTYCLIIAICWLFCIWQINTLLISNVAMEIINLLAEYLIFTYLLSWPSSIVFHGYVGVPEGIPCP